jgi:hypothetical protein
VRQAGIGTLVVAVIFVAIGGSVGVLVGLAVRHNSSIDASNRNTCQTIAKLSHASSYRFNVASTDSCELVVGGKIYEVRQ